MIDQMYLIHGTWIPDDSNDFVQRGGFYLWVETDTVVEQSETPGEKPWHPRHLTGRALQAFLAEKLGIRLASGQEISDQLSAKYFRLPSDDRAPLPSFEMRPYLVDDLPDRFELRTWQVGCYRVPHVLATLNEIHYLALHAPDEYQLGADFLFWHQFSRLLRQVIVKDQYLPSLAYHELAPLRAKASKNTRGAELLAGWEIVSDAYESAIPRYVAAMPRACRAGSTSPGLDGAYDGDTLLRHFAESVLHQAIATTPFTAKYEQEVVGTLLSGAISSDLPANRGLALGAALEEYRRWKVWREKLARTQTGAGFNLGFRLDEAPTSDVDGWQIHFFVVSRQDPSFKLSLIDYWEFDPAARSDLSRYFGRDFEKHLLLAFGQAARVYPKLWEGLETAQPIGLSLNLDDAYAFLKENAWVLEDAGYPVMVPAWWTPAGRRRAKVRLKTAGQAKKASAATAKGYFSFDQLVAYEYQLVIGDQTLTEEEWRQLVAAKTPLVQFRGQWIEVDRDKMQQLLDFWTKHRASDLVLTIPDLLKLTAESEEDLVWDHDPELRDVLARLEDKSAFAPIDDLPTLRATLRDYQRRGVAWLGYLESLGLNPCLADDMGLGKTLEVIAHLVAERDKTGASAPTLVIAPTSVLANWRKEIERFAPQLTVAVHYGSDRLKDERAFGAACRSADVVITSFALARLDEKLLRSLEWRRVVVDEAQNIKNPEAAQTRAIGKLPARHRVALTGTPVENRLLDLWSIFNFLNPGYLGKQPSFRKSFELPIQKGDDPARAATLKKLVEPFILRRLKTDQRIIADLPDKIEQKLYCNLTPEQASLYAAVVKDVEEQLETAEGIGRRGLILATLMKLKQVCNHPAQFLQDGSAFTSDRSHKLQRLGEMLEEVIESGESALVFTQFTEIGAALDEYLARTLRCTTHYLHGGTSAARREKLVAAFQDSESEPSIFILSLRAGGVGLNLTRANHVFHFDRWWNPAVEDQATDRAFRIGQRKNVFVHKFLAVGTVEERIDQMIEDKKRVASSIVGADESWLTELDNDAFKDLIALRRGAVLE